MNMEPTTHSEDVSTALTVVRHRQTETLRECVQVALKNYFDHIGDHSVHNLYRMVMAEVESPLLETVMDYTRGNQTKAAAVLGISRSTLRKKLAQYDLEN